MSGILKICQVRSIDEQMEALKFAKTRRRQG